MLLALIAQVFSVYDNRKNNYRIKYITIYAILVYFLENKKR